MSRLPANATPEETASKTPTAKHKFEGHEREILSFAFLHDNVHVVSGSHDDTIRKWNCDTGRPVGEPWKMQGGRILALVLSPDGKTIACGRVDGSVQRWDTDGNMIKSIWTGHTDWVRSLSWSPSGGHIASGSDDGTILIREAESGKVEVGPIESNQGYVRSVAYSPLGDRIASGGDNTICIWDSNTGKLLVGPIKDLVYGVESVVWSLDGSKLYSASDTFARVFDSFSGTLLHRLEHDHLLTSIALSPRHNVLACVGISGIAHLWDTESHKPLGQPFRQEDHKQLRCVSFSQDGQYLAYGGHDNKITLWIVKDIAPQLTETASPMQSKTPTPKYKFEGHEKDIRCFVFLQDNIHIVSGSLDGTMRKWNCDTGHLVGEPWKGEGSTILTLTLSPDGKTIACGRVDGSVERWDTDGKMMKNIWKGYVSWVQSLSWSPTGGHIASGFGGRILIRETESGKVEVGPIKTNQGDVRSLAYSPLGDRVASGGDKTICIWDSNTGELRVGPIKDLGVLVESVVWSLDGSTLYSASDRFARLWDTELHRPLGQPFRQEDGRHLRCVSFSRDGKYLVYGGDDNKITLWMVQDIAPQLTVRTPVSKIQDITQQETQPEPPSSSFLNVSSTHSSFLTLLTGLS
ncbi:WD40 repeat-like protein [Rhizopogon vinicolor AM-OR11-026]|uniref:WD40 repeat-like protein n=1 Tax=Rhizopogon vinicolor AM-OR11-026 TaxID=1314800 RepID=A0A1B7MMN7_9AGAM|nr:WD40 repeat-like protein [Rhizopogon vinicolor AM-OR11-026]